MNTNENMSVKRIKKIQEACNQEIQKLETQQETYSGYINNITFEKPEKKRVSPKRELYIHQHLNKLPPV
jgi:hypothetical protein